MLKRNLLIAGLLLVILTAYTQTVDVKFLGRDRSDWITLDSISVTNLTRSWTETVVAPDSTIELAIQTGIACYKTNKKASLKQNTPNPFHGTTEVTLFLPQEETVHIAIFDIYGKEDVQKSLKLGAGHHTFKITLRQIQTHFFTASTSTGISSIKMINLKDGGDNLIEYSNWKLDKTTPTFQKSNCLAFAKGDKMQYTAYATVYGEPLSRTVTQQQYEDASILFDMVPQTHLVDKISGENNGIPFSATYTYDNDKHLKQITFIDSANSNSYMKFAYLNNRIQNVSYYNDSITAPHCRTCHFAYDDLGMLQQRIVTENNDTLSVEQFEYDKNLWLRTIITDSDTNLIKAHYDLNGNITRLYVNGTDSLENILDFKYDYHRKPFFNADYLFTEELYPRAFNQLTTLRTLAYNNITEFTTEGDQWIYDYNDAGLPISIEKKNDKGEDLSTFQIIYKEY